jgi:predicted kinase
MNSLIIFGGLPGTGKTTIARQLVRQIGAVHLRIDSIEQAIRDCGPVGPPLDQAGYRAAYAIAEDNLRVGRTVNRRSAFIRGAPSSGSASENRFVIFSTLARLYS